MGKFLKNRDVFKGEVAKKINEYKPVADYELLEVNDREKKELIECEKNIIFHQQKTKEHLMAISETLFKAQEILANHRGGTFRIWFEDLGLKKDFVYMCIKRYRLYLDYENDRVMELPEKVIKEITKESRDIQFSDEDIVKIIEAEKPATILQEIKCELSGNPTTEISPDRSLPDNFSPDSLNSAVIEVLSDDGKFVQMFPTREEVAREKRDRLKTINSQIRDLEHALKNLRKERAEIEEQLERMDNEKLFYEM